MVRILRSKIGWIFNLNPAILNSSRAKVFERLKLGGFEVRGGVCEEPRSKSHLDCAHQTLTIKGGNCYLTLLPKPCPSPRV